MKDGESRHHHLIDKVATLNAVIGSLALYPQLYGLIKETASRVNISKISFCLILSSSVVWFLYGLHRRNIPLIVSSALTFIAAAGILLLIL